MKKISLILLITLLLLAGCAKEAPKPVEQTPTQATDPSEITLEDKIFDNVYAGRVTNITDSEITIKMDERVDETFALNERALADIKDFSIKIDTRVVIKFVSPEDRTITAIEKIVSE